ncbi:MAG: alpha-ketoglutarate-dependent dioxygenase AlkB [Pseudomonadota bacterium]
MKTNQQHKLKSSSTACQCYTDLQLIYYPKLTLNSNLFKIFKQTLAWQAEHLRIYGKVVKVPRQVAWYGDANAIYRYSGVDHQPHPWTNELLEVKHCIENKLGCDFNSVLANYYHDGNDYMGWHADNEKELGQQPLIASLSLGATRSFVLKHKQNGNKIKFYLADRSLLLMRGKTQAYWLHSLPKIKNALGARINLTFRKILA